MITNDMNEFGLVLRGKLAGFREHSGIARNTGNPYTMHYVGIETPVIGGYPGQTQTIDCQVSTNLMKTQFVQNAQSLIGKAVEIEVYVSTFVRGQSGAGFQYNVTSSTKAVRLYTPVKAGS